jgi:CubicO group peptidase (beta-lactamase class C family)
MAYLTGFHGAAATAILLIATLPAPLALAQEADRRVPPDLDSYVNGVMQSFGLPAAAVAIVSADEELLVNGYGSTFLQNGTPVDPATMFPVYSDTKIFVGLAVARLVEAEVLSFEDPLVKWLPELATARAESLREGTVADALSHGLSLDTHDNWLENYPGLDTSETLPWFMIAGEGSRLGTNDYQNENYVLLALVIERATKKPWAAVVREQVLDPLGLSRSALRASEVVPAGNVAPTGDGWVDGLALGPAALGEDRNIAGPWGAWPPGTEDLAADPREAASQPLPFQSSAFDSGQGGFSSAADMARLMRMLMRGGEIDGQRFLTAETLNRMASVASFSEVGWAYPQEEDEYYYRYRWIGNGMPFELFDFAGHECFGHSGGYLGAEISTYVCPDLDIGVSFMATGTLNVDGPTWAVVHRVLSHAAGLEDEPDLTPRMIALARESITEERAELAAEAQALREAGPPPLPPETYVGRFVHPFGGSVEVALTDGSLTMSLGNGARWSLEMLSETHALRRWDGPRRQTDIVTFTPRTSEPRLVLGLTVDEAALGFFRVDDDEPVDP